MKLLNESLTDMRVEVVEEGLRVKYVPTHEDLAECVEMDDVTASRVQRDRHIKLRDHLLPCIDLREVFPHLPPAGKLTRENSIMVLRFGKMQAGIVVDQLLGEHQTVIKPIGKLYENVRCVTGATILGDGEIAVILDTAGLLQMLVGKQNELAAVKRIEENQ